MVCIFMFCVQNSKDNHWHNVNIFNKVYDVSIMNKKELIIMGGVRMYLLKFGLWSIIYDKVINVWMMSQMMIHRFQYKIKLCFYLI